MNDIIIKQNDSQLIKLLSAQRVAYGQCKNFYIFDIISVVIAIFFPVIALILTESQSSINAFGVLWTVAYLITELYRKNKTTEGATIQEQFDTKLFGLPWNKVLCKNAISIDTIERLASKYKKDDLKNWYSQKIKNTLPKQIAIILCQRINFSWEISQRKKFVFILKIVTIFYYLIYIIIGFFKNIGFFDLLIILSPSIPFLVYSVQNILSLKNHIKSKNQALSFIDQELDNYKNNKSIPTIETLRQIQDTIFIERTVPEKVPDWFYRLNKSNNENFIDSLIVTIQNNL